MAKLPQTNIHASPSKEENHFDWVSENINETVGDQLGGLSQAASDASDIASNENIEAGTKTTALALGAVDAGIQAFGAVTGLANNLAESAILPILGALGMQGIACVPIAKQLDPVLGIDVHLVNIPPAVGVPMPHPYIGMMFRSKDFLAAAIASFIPAPPPPPTPTPEDPNNMPSAAQQNADQQAANVNKAVTIGHTAATMAVGMLGATVKIGGFIPRVVAGTPTKCIPHFPMGAGFFPAATAAIEKNKGHALYGSLLALADDDPIAGGIVHLHNSCWDTGAPSPHTFRKSKNTDDETKSKLQLFLPTGVITPIPMATSILTNPVPAPFNPMAMATKAAKGAFGRHFKKLAANIGHGAVNKLIKSDKLKNKLHNDICTKTGHPVDVASGMFFTDEEDFNLNGPILLSWERTWYSKSDYKGPLGNGWHHSYDIGIVIDQQENNITLRMEDGRPIAFRMPTFHTPTFHKAEMLEMRVNEKGEYYVWNIKEEVYYYFTNKKYNEVQLVRSIVNTNSFSIQFKYDNEGHLNQITDSAHRILEVKNDEEGRILNILTLIDSNETVVLATYVYDADGNMIQQTNAVNDSMYFEYQNNLMVKETWRNGLNWFFKYDGTKIGARCMHTWGDGNIQNHKLAFFDGLTKVKNSLGHTTEYYHKNGLVTKKVEPNGAEHHWLYDKDNQLLSETDPMGNAYLYSYDDLGNQTQIVDPTGTTVTTEFIEIDHPHLPTKAIDANRGTWKWEYDDQGNVIERTNPLRAKSKMQYTNGLLQKITDALGNSTQLKYNPQYNIAQVSDNQGNTTHYKYNSLGQCIEITNPKGAVQKRAFDAIGRVTQVTDFDGNEIALTYDGIDNLIHYKDNQQEVRYSYKGMWKLTKRTDKRGTTFYQYNTEEQLTQITNEKMLPYRFLLDTVGNVIKETSFDQETKHYQRDLAGRVTELTKPSGKTTQYKYDNASRITQITHNNNTANKQTFTYNQAGQLLKAVNKDADVEFTRNILGLIETETVNGQSITHTYNSIGRRTNLESSLGANINYQHDSFGNLANLTATKDDSKWEANYEYDSLGFELQRLLPGKLQQSFKYDNIGRLTGQDTLNAKKQRHKRRYSWGVNDRLHQVDDSKQGATTYSYSETGHLKHTKFADGTNQFRIPDAVGNLYETKEQDDREYGYGGRLEKKGSWHYKYNDEGFLIEKYKGSSGLFGSKTNVWKYTWNAEGMLAQVQRPDKQKVSFTYDALGRRLSKKFKNTTTRWLWDGNVPLHEWKENQNGDVLSNSTVGDNGIITWVFEENSFIPTAKLRGDKKYSILVDHLGTPTQMYNEEGETTWERSLNSNGKVIHGGNGSCPFLFQGQYYDSEIELAYNRFRYYSPDTGTYISQDPIGLASGEPNFYAYVKDSNTYIDVFGLMPWPDLKPTGVGHHMVPKTHASQFPQLEALGHPTKAPSWYPNNSSDTGILHQDFHNKLTENGVPRTGKFEGTADDLVSKSRKAYKGYDQLGFVKFGKGKNAKILATDVTPLEAFDKITKWNQKNNIKCG